MKISIKHTSKGDGLKKLEAGIKAIDNRQVNVGMPTGSEQAYIAAIHEWGVNIPVTDKMRKWFIAQGHPLKKTTTQIVIPERSFFRNGMDAKGDKIIEKYEKIIGDVLYGSMSVEQFLDGLGNGLASAIKDYATELSSPANSGFTIEMKGSSNPLVGKSGGSGMIGAISYEVK